MRRLAGVLIAAALALPAEAPALPTPSVAVARPRIVADPIPYGAARRRQMARYSGRHYGHRIWRLRRRRVIVLHFTAGSSYSGAWRTFASNAPARGELPGVCAHYLIGKAGRIGELVPPRIRCRHAIGLNHRAIGIEMVQEAGRGSHWAARQILSRRSQIRPALRLVAWLKQRFDITMRDVIGHAMVNHSPYFRDLRGWRNDHADWLRAEVKRFRRRLRRLIAA
jgi:hypothetical protein